MVEIGTSQRGLPAHNLAADVAGFRMYRKPTRDMSPGAAARKPCQLAHGKAARLAKSQRVSASAAKDIVRKVSEFCPRNALTMWEIS